MSQSNDHQTAVVESGGQPTSDPAVASQRYYKAICAMLDGLHGTASAQDTAVWVRS